MRQYHFLVRELLLLFQDLALATLDVVTRFDDGVWSYDTKINGRAYHVVKLPGGSWARRALYHFMTPDVTVIVLSNTGTTDLDKLVAEIGKQVVP